MFIYSDITIVRFIKQLRKFLQWHSITMFMIKTIGELIDGLSIVNIKIFYLVDKVLKNEHTREDAKKIQDLNLVRSGYVNAINDYFKENQPDIKVGPDGHVVNSADQRISSRNETNEVEEPLKETFSPNV